MPSFSEQSRANLAECHPDLQRLFNEVVKRFDCSVIEGWRGEEEQNKAFHAGKSKLMFPDSNHNKSPSLAVDVVPYPVDWEDVKRFNLFAGYVLGVAESMGIRLRWGGDWDGDMETTDQSFHDLPHFELMGD